MIQITWAYNSNQAGYDMFQRNTGMVSPWLQTFEFFKERKLKDKTRYRRDFKIIFTHRNKKVNLELPQGEPILFSNTFYCYQNNP